MLYQNDVTNATLKPRRSDSFATKRNLVEIIRFTLFSRHVVFDCEGDKFRNKRIEDYITVSVAIDMECGTQKMNVQNGKDIVRTVSFPHRLCRRF